jgi:hypothetical protein
MKTTLTCLVVCVSLALPFAAMAALTDAQYCEALSTEYRKLNSDAASGPQADAMAQCKAGNTAAGIPVAQLDPAGRYGGWAFERLKQTDARPDHTRRAFQSRNIVACVGWAGGDRRS